MTQAVSPSFASDGADACWSPAFPALPRLQVHPPSQLLLPCRGSLLLLLLLPVVMAPPSAGLLLLLPLQPALHILEGPAAGLFLHAAAESEPTSQLLLACSHFPEATRLALPSPFCFAAAASGITRGAEQLVLAVSFAEASDDGGSTEQQLLWQLQHAPLLLLLLVLGTACPALWERDGVMVILTESVLFNEGMCWAVEAAAWLLVAGGVGCSDGWLQVADAAAALGLLTWSCACVASAVAAEADSLWLQLQLMYSGAPCKARRDTGHQLSPMCCEH